ncbi:MAG TPA: NUDIX hydrolase [Polyangia bacterium]|nr:NUDIX hydrolase [Polyangia bacterium]
MAAAPRLFAIAPAGKWISAGGVVFDQKGRIALVRQWDRSSRLRWTLPKGRLDPGETLTAAALREVYEEAGVRVRITSYLGRYKGKRHFTHYFRMLLVRDDGCHDTSETAEVRFVKPAKARRLMRSRRDRTVLEWAQAVSAQARAA